MSSLVTVVPGAAGAADTATVATATVTDIFTTLFSSDKAVTGMYGFAQKAGLVVAGMSINAKRYRNSFNPFAR